jgi:hypothetical protein
LGRLHAILSDNYFEVLRSVPEIEWPGTADLTKGEVTRAKVDGHSELCLIPSLNGDIKMVENLMKSVGFAGQIHSAATF